MSFSPQDQNILDHLYKAGTAHPDLEALFHFYEQLFQVQFAFKARLKDDRHPVPDIWRIRKSISPVWHQESPR